MFTLHINAAHRSNVIRATVRRTLEEDTVTGHVSRSWSQEEDIVLEAGTVLGKTEVLSTIFGKKITTMVVEGLDGLGLNLTTDTSARDSIFGENSVTVVRIQSDVESLLSAARVSRPMPRRNIEEVRISVRRAERPRTRLGF
jgi:nicotinate-nucleotide pyrophosphorylase